MSGPGRATLIVATLGPASRDPAVIRRMIEEGADWVRLNFSHGGHDEQARAAEAVRAVAGVVGRPVKLVADLGSAKVRIGALSAPLDLRPGDRVTLGSGREVPDAIAITRPQALVHRGPGEVLALADGTLELEVVDAAPGWVRCRVVTGGLLRSHQPVLMAGASDGLPALSSQDVDDVEAAVALGVDAIVLANVRRREDLAGLRARLPVGVQAIARIEEAQALAELGRIVQEADGVVVVRGALAFSLPRAEAPLVQKDVLAQCAAEGTTGLVATELLSSMVRAPRPTRTEIGEVVTALLDGADALVLSEETAVGAHPAEAVAELRTIVEATEASGHWQASRPRRQPWWPFLGQ